MGGGYRALASPTRRTCEVICIIIEQVFLQVWGWFKPLKSLKHERRNHDVDGTFQVDDDARLRHVFTFQDVVCKKLNFENFAVIYLIF